MTVIGKITKSVARRTSAARKREMHVETSPCLAEKERGTGEATFNFISDIETAIR